LLALITATCTASAAANSGGDIVQLGFRAEHRCVLHANGMVDCVSESPYLGGWRGNGAAYRPVRMIPRGATRLAVGGFASCAMVKGALDCWNGLPASGKEIAAPKRVIASGVTDVSVGDDHACAAANGAALCWGRDADGQVGHNDYQDDRLGTAQSKPWQVIAHGVTRVAAGGDLSCAIVGGALWCWGNTGLAHDPSFGGYPGDHSPVRVFAHGVSAVAAGARHACAIIDGALWCWGDNNRGQVGIGYSNDHARHSPQTPPYDASKRGTFTDGDQTCSWDVWQHPACKVEHPVKVIAHGVTAVYADGDETCALVDDALWCWGYNWAGQLGIASNKQNVLKPTLAIPGGVAFATVTSQRTCAVMRDGTLRCTAPCAKNGDAMRCPAQPAFVAGDPNDMSGVEARVGVWRGTIGDAKVMVCLERPDTFNDSMYYYLRHRFSIGLSANDNSGATWNEAPPNQRSPDWSKPAAVWTLQVPDGDRMEGTWSVADGSRTVPIQLARVAEVGQGRGAGCGAGNDSPAGRVFNAPRVASQKLSISQSSDGVRTISALDGHVSMVELPSSIPNATRFNTAARGWLADNIAEYYDCAFNSLDGVPDYDDSSEIDLLAPPWLVTRENYSAFCGGAHPSSGTSYTVWNLDAGKTVDPWGFIKTIHATDSNDHCDNAYACQQVLPPRLRAILVARFKHDNAGDGDCADVLDTDSSFILHPEKAGLVFSTTFPHVIQACDEDIALPWATVAPFLTAEGLAVMRSLRQGH
jgi:hypothetical protein